MNKLNVLLITLCFASTTTEASSLAKQVRSPAHRIDVFSRSEVSATSARTEVKISLACEDVEKLRPILEKNKMPEKRLITTRDDLVAGIAIRMREPVLSATALSADSEVEFRSPDVTVKINCLVASQLTVAEREMLEAGLKCEANKPYQKPALPSCSYTTQGTQLSPEQFAFLKQHTGVDLANFKGTVRLKPAITSVNWKLPKDLKKKVSVLDEVGEVYHPKVAFEEWIDQSGKCQSFEVSTKVLTSSAIATEAELAKLLSQEWSLAINPLIQGNKSGKFECPLNLQ